MEILFVLLLHHHLLETEGNRERETERPRDREMKEIEKEKERVMWVLRLVVRGMKRERWHSRYERRWRQYVPSWRDSPCKPNSPSPTSSISSSPVLMPRSYFVIDASDQWIKWRWSLLMSFTCWACRMIDGVRAPSDCERRWSAPEPSWSCAGRTSETTAPRNLTRP